MDDALVLLLCRILCWLFPPTLTALRRITMLLTWKTVGLHGARLCQLFFSCHLSPKGRRLPKNRSHKIGPDDLRY
jgi:hypothetical protein